MGNNFFDRLSQKYPFISLCVSGSDEYVGVIQNRDDIVTTLYDYGAVHDHDQKIQFLDLAAVWWWESNHSVPINIFLGQDWQPFRYTLRTFTNKEMSVIHGPVCSLSEIAKRKIKRRSITLVRPIQ
jgi:hypothetical protein